MLMPFRCYNDCFKCTTVYIVLYADLTVFEWLTYSSELYSQKQFRVEYLTDMLLWVHKWLESSNSNQPTKESKVISGYWCKWIQLLHTFSFRVEKSTDQVVKPINLEALTAWVKHFPVELRYTIRLLAPMLVRLGYDPDSYPPSYGKADISVTNNTVSVKENEQYWLKQASAALQLSKIKEPTMLDDFEQESTMKESVVPHKENVVFRPQALPIIVYPENDQSRTLP